MDFISSTIVGYFFGFTLGVGCALAVMYSIYSGGYRKGVEDSLRQIKPERYLRRVPRALQHIKYADTMKQQTEPSARAADSSLRD